MLIQIIGAHGDIFNVDETLKIVEKFSSNKGIEIQLLNASLIFSKNHLKSAVNHALRAFLKKDKKQKLGIEILLYASCERQISLAIKKMGIKKGDKKFAIVIIGACDTKDLLKLLKFERDDSLLDAEFSILKYFGVNDIDISYKEGKAEDLLLEKITLLELIK